MTTTEARRVILKSIIEAQIASDAGKDNAELSHWITGEHVKNPRSSKARPGLNIRLGE